MKLSILVTFLSLHTITLQSGESSLTVTLPNGNRLTSLYLTSVHTKRSYVEFRGIRFAKAPVGELRFQPPVPYEETWGSEPRDATEYGSVCPQLDPWYDPDQVEGGSWDELRVLGNEDCLFANFATPDVNSESGNEYGIAKLMDYDIVTVTFNYRFGPFGFLTVDGENGNIQGNNGFFKSATAISPWVFTKDPNERAVQLAKHLKCGNDTNVETCLMGLDAVKIIQKLPRLAVSSTKFFSDKSLHEIARPFVFDLSECASKEWYIDPLVPFGPSIEKAGSSHERFLSRNPYNILAEGEYWAKNMPVVMGVNSHEGLLHAMDIGHSEMLRRVFNLEWNGAAPISLYYKKSAIDPRMVSDAVRNYYFPIIDENKINGSLPLVDKDYMFSNLTNLYSDRHFFVPLHHSALTMGKHNEVYLYWFDYVSEQTIHGLYGYNSSQTFGPSHYDQLQYLFVTPFFNETKGEDNLKFENKFLNGFTKFIKEGSPFRNDWVKVTEEMTEGSVPFIYNRIGKSSDAPNLVEPFITRVEFWNSQLIMEYSQGGFLDQLMEQGEKMASNKDEL